MMKCKDCPLPHETVHGYACPYREHVNMDDDACEAAIKARTDADSKASTVARGRMAAREYEATTPHGEG